MESKNHDELVVIRMWSDVFKNYNGHLITHDTAALPYIHWLYRLKVMVLVSVWVILALCLLDMGT